MADSPRSGWRALGGRRDLGQIGLGGREQLGALARAFFGQPGIAAHHQTLAGEVLARQFEQVALVEQRGLEGAMLGGELRDLGCAQATHPIQTLGLEHLLDARRGEHAAIAHPHDVLDTEARAQLAHLRGHGGRIPRVARKHLHRDRATLAGADQAEHDLRIVALAVARVPARGQRAAASRQPSRGQVVQHQGRAHQVPTGQPPLDAWLRRVQPVQCSVQLTGIALTHSEHTAQR